MRLTRGHLLKHSRRSGSSGTSSCRFPKFDASEYPEVEKLIKAGINREQYHFRLDESQMEKIFQGSAPANDGTQLTTLAEPAEKYPIPSAPERPEEFAPGLDPELAKLADSLVEAKKKVTKKAIDLKCD